MQKFLTKVRGYAWYCPRCKEHKDIERVNVVKVVKSNYMTMICTDCNTEVVDCFLIKTANKSCNECSDRFKCLTRTDAIVEKKLRYVKTHEISSVPNVVDTRNIEGVRSYTGIYNHKLERDDEFCAYPEREDCNNSWQRQNYNGDPYNRCVYMRYDIKAKIWHCRYGESKRGK